ncbi:hypothetical protein SASPL_102707 [Salvia splendens]|uniref:Uncharacterized protein n=1 Tax=Salvia splendens TaxID=180675 RepID=A0A8X8YT43_SALSN|nr:uncharacterized protein LOC121751662 [Salvia splendens]KAG6437779.1 hypothetical protein SASPL_102707 [Salvia splendens]
MLMEFLSSRISTNLQISAPISFLTWKGTRYCSTLTIPNSKRFPLQLPLSTNVFRTIPSRNFRISAHFGRASSRQNYLRKKLTKQHKQHQVSEDLHKLNTHDSNFESSSEMTLNLERGSGVSDEPLDAYGEVRKNVDKLSQNEGVIELGKDFRKKNIGESIMWNKLEGWVEQYKKDSQFWGIGTGPIFSVFQDAEGKVERVVVNEDEILRRSRVDPQLDNEDEVLAEVDFKISFAKDLAREMEEGSNVIPKNSSVAKFVQSGAEGSRFVEAVRSVAVKSVSFPSMSKVGVLVLCGLSVVWAIRGLFTVGKDSKGEYTAFEKEMLRRKMKARTKEEKMVKGSVEVMQVPVEPKGVSLNRPQLDKEELVNSIIKAKGSNNQLGIVDQTSENELQGKIEEIRAMARHARETERRDALQKSNATSKNELPREEEVSVEDIDERREHVSITDSDTDTDDGIELSINGASDDKCETELHNITPNGSLKSEVSYEKEVSASSNLTDANVHSDGSDQYKNSSPKKIRIIKYAKEAREYLLRKHQTPVGNQKDDVGNNEHADISSLVPTANVASGNTSPVMDLTEKVHDPTPTSGIDEFSYPFEDCSLGSETPQGNADNLNHSETSRIYSDHDVNISNKVAGVPVDNIPKAKDTDIETRWTCNSSSDTSSFLGGIQKSKVDAPGKPQTEKVPTQLRNHKSEDTANNGTLVGIQESVFATSDEVNDTTNELAPLVSKENWMEKNFNEFEPIVDKIGAGFRDSYQLAKEKASQGLGSETDLTQLKSDDAESELEWMKDERLREIVFKVRDNELSGRDPFHLMDEEDKLAFFNGLDKKVEQENRKLLKLHEYLHSNIDNLDYGADGISVYDPPEKVIPRWKVPPAERNPEFLNNFVEQRKELVSEGLKSSFLSRKTAKEDVNTSEKLSSLENSAVAANDSDPRAEVKKDISVSSKTVIEGSDGSIRAGKKQGKAFWQHTKKWSEGFLESYNAESDPEAKAVMRDIGEDLDRWITEKEIKEAAELMDKLPEKGFIKQKLNKVRREMELYGPQAVVSKYREYAEEKEEDYLWWLDLPHVLCIELYTVEDGEERAGFYSLEMAADLELDPKPYHVIAFEDAGDCKNLCYIIQAKMEMLGNGNVFVIARPPKDAYREAKANGFSVTVIKKGQLQLNMDQTLEEVEESIAEIGSKIYHDSITKERSVDVNGLMKGVFGITKPTTKRKKSKRKSRRQIKP